MGPVLVGAGRAGHPVVAVSPKAIKAWREAEFSAQAKSDPGDARVMCDYRRLRFARLRVPSPTARRPARCAPRAAVRARDDLVAPRVATANQLRAALDAFWPGAAAVFSSLFSPIALAFLDAYPTPAASARLGERRMASFLRRHRYTGRRSAAELVERLRAAPPGIAAGPEADARRTAVLVYAAVLSSLNAAIAALDDSVATHLGVHPDAGIFASLPRSGRTTAAQLLAERGDCRDAYDGPQAVAALAGAAPVTEAPGKHHSVHFRWACNKRFACWASRAGWAPRNGPGCSPAATPPRASASGDAPPGWRASP